MMLAEANPNWQLVSVNLEGFGPTTVIPEPSTVLLLLVGLTMLLVTSRRRRV